MAHDPRIEARLAETSAAESLVQCQNYKKGQVDMDTEGQTEQSPMPLRQTPSASGYHQSSGS
jgi:hypothetical protein